MARIAFDIDGVIAHGLELRDLNRGIDNEIYSGLEFARESLSVINSIRNGNRIYVLTARNEKLIDVTQDWLNRHKFKADKVLFSPYQEWCMAPYYKAKIVRRHGIEILVDDSPEIVDYVNRTTECRAIMFTDWNKVCEKIKLRR